MNKIIKAGLCQRNSCGDVSNSSCNQYLTTPVHHMIFNHLKISAFGDSERTSLHLTTTKKQIQYNNMVPNPMLIGGVITM